MVYKLRKSGHSMAVTIPPYIKEQLDLKSGEEVDITLQGKKIIIKRKGE